MKARIDFLMILVGFLAIQACETPIVEVPDPDLIRLEDINQINLFISDNNLGIPDTTENGARYFTYHEGDQTQEKIKRNDIVTFDYTAFYLEDSFVLYTSVPFIADTALLDTLDASTFTYSETGWSLRYVAVTAQYLPGGGTALMEAIGASFKEMVPGDRVVVFLPTDQSSTTTSITESRVVFYDIAIKEDEE